MHSLEVVNAGRSPCFSDPESSKIVTSYGSSHPTITVRTALSTRMACGLALGRMGEWGGGGGGGGQNNNNKTWLPRKADLDLKLLFFFFFFFNRLVESYILHQNSFSRVVPVI